MTSSWGRVVTVNQVRRGLKATLETWLPAAVFEVARQDGLDDRLVDMLTPTVRSWRRLANLENDDVDQLPALFVTSPGLAGTPRRKGGGLYDATWSVTASVVLIADDPEDAAELLGVYLTAAHLVAVQHPAHGELRASNTTWIGEDYDALNAQATRLIGFSDFEITVKDVADASLGPDVPPEVPSDPSPDLPELEQVFVTTTKEPLS